MTDDVEIDLGIQDIWKRIYTEWFPSTSFEQVEGPCIEKYYWVDDQHQNFITEVWIPVRKIAEGIKRFKK
jgi:AraC family transcriptional regulator